MLQDKVPDFSCLNDEFPRISEFLSATQDVTVHRDAIFVTISFVTMKNGELQSERLHIYICPDKLLTLGAVSQQHLDDFHKILESKQKNCSAAFASISLFKLFLENIAEVVYTLDSIQTKLESHDEISDIDVDVLSQVKLIAIQVKIIVQIIRTTVNHLSLGSFISLSKDEIHQLQNINTIVTHHLQDMATLLERRNVIKEEISTRAQETLNSRIYILTLLSIIILPINTITSLLGINVGGVPGANNQFAFATVCGLIFLIVFISFLLLKKYKWL